MNRESAGRPPTPWSLLVTGSELNRLLESGTTAVRVTSDALTIDEPIRVRRDGITLDLEHTVLETAGTHPYILRVESSHGIHVTGGEFVSGRSAILVDSSEGAQIENVTIRDLRGHGIVVTGSRRIELTGNRIRSLLGAGVLIHRGTSASVIHRNVIGTNLGASNMAAGIVISDREVDLATDPDAIFGPDRYWVISQPIPTRLNSPHDNLIAFNEIRSNASSGVYVDGGIGNVIVSNIIDGNSKEGLCLDNGSTGNVVASNVVQQNGKRWGESDSVLAHDFVLTFGRLFDGTAAAKVPGVSIDNAMYNIVFANNVSHNFGGGIKFVRTAYFNVVGMNTVFSNNDGANDRFHFFGIELGAAPGDSSAADLDFTPSRGNILFSNIIRGNHYAGIYFASGSDENDVFDNVIMDSEVWALESVVVMRNHTLNNLTNLPSRNVGPGLDPALLVRAQPRAVVNQ